MRTDGLSTPIQPARSTAGPREMSAPLSGSSQDAIAHRLLEIKQRLDEIAPGLVESLDPRGGTPDHIIATVRTSGHREYALGITPSTIALGNADAVDALHEHQPWRNIRGVEFLFGSQPCHYHQSADGSGTWQPLCDFPEFVEHHCVLGADGELRIHGRLGGPDERVAAIRVDANEEGWTVERITNPAMDTLSVAADHAGRVFTVEIPKDTKLEECKAYLGYVAAGHGIDCHDNVLVPHPIITDPNDKHSYLGPCEAIWIDGDLLLYRTPSLQGSAHANDGWGAQQLYRIPAAAIKSGQPHPVTPTNTRRTWYDHKLGRTVSEEAPAGTLFWHQANPKYSWVAQPIGFKALPDGATLRHLKYVASSDARDNLKLEMSYTGKDGRVYCKWRPANSKEWSEAVRRRPVEGGTALGYRMTRNVGLAQPEFPTGPLSDPASSSDPVASLAKLLIRLDGKTGASSGSSSRFNLRQTV